MVRYGYVNRRYKVYILVVLLLFTLSYIAVTQPTTGYVVSDTKITILNEQSYPTLGGEWTVMFDTAGTADLIITAVDGTYWGKDIDFLEIWCGDNLVEYEWIDEKVFVDDYSCDGTSFEKSKVLTAGKHHLLFTFGDKRAYAHNDVNITSCYNITTPGEYTLNESIAPSSAGFKSYCINITAENVTLDCQGNTIGGDDTEDYGVYSYPVSQKYTNITIKNCNVSDWATAGIFLRNADNNTLINITANSNPDGIYLYDSDYNNLTYITADSNTNGVYLRTTASNILTGIVTTSSIQNGIYINGDNNGLVLSNSHLANNSFWDFNVILSCNGASSASMTLINVTGTDNKPIVFFNESVTIEHWNNNASEIILCNADNSVINNVTMYHIDDESNGIFLSFTDNSNISNINVSDSYVGIYLRNADNNRIENITANSNVYGISNAYGTGNTFSNITIISNSYLGINNDANNNVFTGLIVMSNTWGGLTLINGNNNIINNSYFSQQTVSGSEAIFIDDDNNTIQNVIMDSNDRGLALDTTAENNTIIDCIINNSVQYGVYIDTSGQYGANKFYNNLFNNTINVEFNGAVYENDWNTTQQSGTRIYSSGTNIGGNYWTNGTGNHFSDNCTDSNTDGFCDDGYDLITGTNCTIGVNCGNNSDLLPLSDEYLGNVAPDTPVVSINSTDGTNQTTQDLNCVATITDNDDNVMNVSVQWYNNSVFWLQEDFNNSYGNGTLFNATLGSGNISQGEYWNCSVRTNDGTSYGGWGNSSNVTVVSYILISDCYNITTPDEYLLTTDITSSSDGFKSACINITAENVTFDCQGNRVIGDKIEDYGIYSYPTSQKYMNTTIQNCIVNEWDSSGIYLRNSDNSTILNTNTSNNGDGSGTDTGIALTYADNTRLNNITANNNTNRGVYTQFSDYTVLNNSDFDSNRLSINAVWSRYGIITVENTIMVNSTNQDLSLDDSCNTDENNVINVTGNDDRPILFYDTDGNTVENLNVSALILCGADNSVVNNITAITVDLFNTDNSNLSNLTIADVTRDGITISDTSTNNRVTDSNISSKSIEFISTSGAGNSNSFININIGYTVSGFYGILLSDSYNLLDGITFTDPGVIDFVIFVNGDNNTIRNVVVDGAEDYGIRIDKSGTNITNCTITNSGIAGIYMNGAGSLSNNYIFNNLFNNTVNIEFGGAVYPNDWNTTRQNDTRIIANGPEMGGNFWANYSNTSSGYSIICTDNNMDGFCDSPYDVITGTNCTIGSTCGNNTDFSPLSDEYIVPSIQFVNITNTLAHTNDTINCEFNVTGSPVITVNVTWLRDGTTIFTNNSISITSGVLNTQSLKWNYTYHDKNITCQINASNAAGTSPLANVSIIISNYTTALTAQNSTDDPVAGTEMFVYANYSGPFGDIGRIIWNTTDISDGVNALTFWDMDNDGVKDELAVIQDGGWNDVGFYAYHSNGSQAFKSTGVIANSASDIIAADLDNDSYDEIILMTNAQVVIYNNTGGVIYQNDSLVGSLVVGDFDDQGFDNDLIMGIQDSDDYEKRIWVLNSSNGTDYELLWTSGIINNIQYSNGLLSLGIADINNDGKDDPYVVDQNSGHFLSFNSSNGAPIFNTSDLGEVYSALALDIDNDGNTDEVAVGEVGNLYVFEFNGSHGVTYGAGDAIWMNASVVSTSYKIRPLDLDNDGNKDDFVLNDDGGWNTDEGYIRAFDNNSAELWISTLPADSSGAFYMYAMEADDLDDDTDYEIIVSEQDYDNIYVIDKWGNVTWNYSINQGNVGRNGLKLGDVNYDGIRDIAVSSPNGYVHVFQDVSCDIVFNDGTSYNMTWNITQSKWQTSKTFSSSGTFEYNITCGKGGYDMKNMTSEITVFSASPDTPIVSINSTDGLNMTLSNLSCFATITNPTDTVMNVSVKWYNNSVFWFQEDFNNSYPNNTFFNATLRSGNTTKGEYWNCSMMAHNATHSGGWGNSSNVTIVNSVPLTISSRIAPVPALDNETIFGYCNATDADENNVTYYYEWYVDGIINETGYNVGNNVQQTIIVDDTEDESGASGVCSRPTQAYDENWITYASCDAFDVTCSIYINYTIPDNVVNVINEVGSGRGGVDAGTYVNHYCYNNSNSEFYQFGVESTTFENYTIPNDCLGDTKLVLRYDIVSGSTAIGYLYEEQMWWNTSSVSGGYESGKEIIINNISSDYLTAADNWTFSCLANDGTVNATNWLNDSVIIQSSNIIPNTPIVSINSTDGTNITTQDLNCYTNITDDNNDLLNVTVQWYNNSVFWFQEDFNNSYASGTIFNTTLTSGNTSVDEYWNCSVRTYDGFNYSGWGNSTNLTIAKRVVYSKFDGNTTDFSSLNDSELENIMNMTLEISSYGKIIFNETINLTTDAVNGTVDLNSNVNITENLIWIDTDTLTSLENPAMLYLYDLDFSDPRILRNGEVCSSICQEISYSGGTYIFNVAQFTSYSAEETPSQPVQQQQPPAGPTGTTTVDTTTVSDFTIDKDLIKAVVKQGGSVREQIIIENTGDNIIDIAVDAGSLGKFMAISEDSFSLSPSDKKTINIDIFSKEDELPDAYTGRITVSGGGKSKVVNVILEIKGKEALFDVIVDVIDKTVRPGDNVKANIQVINMGDLYDIDITHYIAIKDFEGNVLTMKQESLAIEDKLTLERTIKTPENILSGSYVFYSDVLYGDSTAAGADAFEVIGEEARTIQTYVYESYLPKIFGAITLVILLIIIVWKEKIKIKINKKRKTRSKKKRRINKKYKSKPRKIKRRKKR
ncbi:NosD domain-containing protein [Candidatus Aenigmatarchaeota archaeon]